MEGGSWSQEDGPLPLPPPPSTPQPSPGGNTPHGPESPVGTQTPRESQSQGECTQGHRSPHPQRGNGVPESGAGVQFPVTLLGASPLHHQVRRKHTCPGGFLGGEGHANEMT